MKRIALFLLLAGTAFAQQNNLQKLTLVNPNTGERIDMKDEVLIIKGEPYYVEQFTLGATYGFIAPSPIPTPQPTVTPTPTPTPTPTATPTPTPTPTATPSPSLTPTPTATPSPTPTITPTPTLTPSPSPSPTPSTTPTPSLTPTPTGTPPSPTPTATIPTSPTPTPSPSLTPPSPTVTPSPSPGKTNATVSIINPTQGDTYDIYYGRAIGQYGSPVPIPRGESSVVVTGLTTGNKYYFTSIVTRLGQSSAMSDPIAYTPGISKMIGPTGPGPWIAFILLLLISGFFVVKKIEEEKKGK